MFHQKMIPPSILVMFNPIIVGSLFVVETIVNLLATTLIFGTQVKSLHTKKTYFNTLEVSNIVMKCSN
jgi:hypothetical protein